MELEKLLKDKSTLKRRQAVKYIIKNNVIDEGPNLYEAFLNELNYPRYWETTSEMVKALGIIKYKKATHKIFEICKKNKGHDMVTINAATAYVRLARSSIYDGTPIIDLLKFARFSVATGAFSALGIDRMKPSNKQIEKIIDFAKKFKYENGYGDPVYGLAVAAAGWNGNKVVNFLNQCLNSPDSGTVNAAVNSLEGKYIKHR